MFCGIELTTALNVTVVGTFGARSFSKVIPFVSSWVEVWPFIVTLPLSYVKLSGRVSVIVAFV